MKIDLPEPRILGYVTVRSTRYGSDRRAIKGYTAQDMLDFARAVGGPVPALHDSALATIAQRLQENASEALKHLHELQQDHYAAIARIEKLLRHRAGSGQ